MRRPGAAAPLTVVETAVLAPEIETQTAAAHEPEAPQPEAPEPALVEAAIKDVRALAQSHGAEAIAALVKIVKDGTSEASRIAAANALLDRAYGKVRPGAAPPEDGEGGETRLKVMFV